jgi:hypothetical protein
MLQYNDWQSSVLAITPRVTGTLSILASSYIVQHVLLSPNKRKNIYHRLLLCMSLNDIIGSFFGYALSSIPMPVGTKDGARGSNQTCSMAAFFSQGGNLAAPLYNGSLATFYLVMIAYGWKEDRIRRQLEPMFHILPNIIGWGTAIAGLPMKLYAPANWTCWIAPYPPGCKTSWSYGPEEANCERGDNFYIYRFAFKYIHIWVTIAYVIAVMCIIYRKVLTTERTNDRYVYPGTEDRATQRKRKKSHQIANQALMYVGALILTFSFGTAVRSMQFARDEVPFGLMFCMVVFNPLQGSFNLMIYLRPRYHLFRNSRENKDAPWHTVFRRFLLHTFCSCGCMKLHRPNCLRGSSNDSNDDPQENIFSSNHRRTSRRRTYVDKDFPGSFIVGRLRASIVSIQATRALCMQRISLTSSKNETAPRHKIDEMPVLDPLDPDANVGDVSECGENDICDTDTPALAKGDEEPGINRTMRASDCRASVEITLPQPVNNV